MQPSPLPAYLQRERWDDERERRAAGAVNAHVVANRQQGQHAVGSHWQTRAEQTSHLVDDDELPGGGAGEDVAAVAALNSSVMVSVEAGGGEADGLSTEEVLQGLDVVLYEVHSHTGIVEGEEAVQGQLRASVCFGNSAWQHAVTSLKLGVGLFRGLGY